MTPRTSTLTSESRNLDLLRAVAVLCVFLAHLFLELFPPVINDRTGPMYALGRFGVLIFFVHTSLVLMLSLDRSRTRHLFLNFYTRRFFRIYPLSTACILIVLLFRIPELTHDRFLVPDWRQVLSNLLLIQNVTHTEPLISPLWTLPFEVQMYAILPVIYVALRKNGSILFVLLLWLAIFVALPFIPLLAFVPCFMGGVLAYQISKGKTFRAPAPVWPAALMLLLAFYLWFRHGVADDYRPDFGISMVLGALIPNFRDLKSSRLTAACEAIARYSYGIYLFHMPVVWLVFVKMKEFPTAVRWVSLCVLMVAVPWGAYHRLEAPLIGIGRRFATRWFGDSAPRPERNLAVAVK